MEEWFTYPLSLHCPLLEEEERGELQEALVVTRMELEKTVVEAMGEIRRKEEEVRRLKAMLRKTMEERDDAIASCERLVWEKKQKTAASLPEKGNLLKAVVEAGPLLHTLLAAMPLISPRSPLSFPTSPLPWRQQQQQQLLQGRKRKAVLGRSLSAP